MDYKRYKKDRKTHMMDMTLWSISELQREND